jgi:hypothetical protein
VSWSCTPEERSLALRFKALSASPAEGAGGALAVEVLLLPFAREPLAGTLHGALAGVEVVDFISFLAGSAESVSDSSGRFLVIILDCVPDLTPPKKLKGSGPFGALLGLTDLDAVAEVEDFGVGLVDFATPSDAFLGGLVPKGDGTFGLVSVNLRGLMPGLCVVEVVFAGLCAVSSFGLATGLVVAVFSGFFGRGAAIDGVEASVLALVIALSFLEVTFGTSLSDDCFEFDLTSLDSPGASLAEDSRRSAAAGRDLGAGLGGSFLDTPSFFDAASSLTSPSSSSSELCTISSDITLGAAFLGGIGLLAVTFLGLLSRSLAAAAASLASFSCFFFSMAPFFFASFSRFSRVLAAVDFPVAVEPLPPRGAPVLPKFGVVAALA